MGIQQCDGDEGVCIELNQQDVGSDCDFGQCEVTGLCVEFLQDSLRQPDTKPSFSAATDVIALGQDLAVLATSDEENVVPSARFFEKSEGSWVQTFVVFGENFNPVTSAEIDDTFILIGHGYAGPGGVSKYKFDQVDNSWIKEDLAAPDENWRRLGQALSVEGDTLMATASYAYNTADVAVYNRDGEDWSFAQRLTVSDNGYPPEKVTIKGGYAAILKSYVAYVYRRQGGSWEPYDVIDGAFITDFDVAEDQIAVASGDELVEVYALGGPKLILESTVPMYPDPEVTVFGTSVLFVNGDLYVGVRSSRDPYLGNGTVNIYQENGGEWELAHALGVGQESSMRDFGARTALFGGSVAIGIPGSKTAYIWTSGR